MIVKEFDSGVIKKKNVSMTWRNVLKVRLKQQIIKLRLTLKSVWN